MTARRQTTPRGEQGQNDRVAKHALGVLLGEAAFVRAVAHGRSAFGQKNGLGTSTVGTVGA
jgi:hypothetical protein